MRTPVRATVACLVLVAVPLLAGDGPTGERRRFEPSGLEMALIAPGAFDMGCAAGDTECFPDEKPRRHVTLTRGLWISVTEVTVGQFRAFAVSTQREMPPQPPWSRDDHPVVNVTWDDAVAFCSWAGARLPTEAEWEYAARGTATGTRYPWGEEPSHEFANYEGAEARDRWTRSAPVASFEPNGFGLHDMIGNVWEWCGDWYSQEAYAAGDATDPTGPPSGALRVLRGGSWNYAPRSLRLSNRGRFQAGGHNDSIGIRCVREIGEELAAPEAPPPVPVAPTEAPVAAEGRDGDTVARGNVTPPPEPTPIIGAPAAVEAIPPRGDVMRVPPPSPTKEPGRERPAATTRRFPPADDEMAWFPPGTVEVGCVKGDGDCDGDEQPRHPVTFARGFWIGVAEVRMGHYRAFSEATGRPMRRQPEWSADDHPVVNVDWDDATAYCSWSGGRLPSEAEWEAAARFGTDGFKYLSGRRLDVGTLNADGTADGDRFEKTSPVGSFAPNGLGLFDMAGNVWEWCADWYDPRSYTDAPGHSPTEPAEGSLRVVRGGSWTSNAWRLRLSYRFRLAPSETSVTLGFRCVRDPVD